MRLRPGAAYLLLGSPVWTIVNRRVELEAPPLATLDRLVEFVGERLRGRIVDARVEMAVQRIERSAGEIIGCLDADSFVAPDALVEVVKELERDPSMPGEQYLPPVQSVRKKYCELRNALSRNASTDVPLNA